MNLAAVMTLNSASFVGGLSGVRGALAGTLGRLAALSGGAISLAGALAGVRSALDFGGKLSDLSAVTGVAVGDLVVLRQAFEDTGVGAEQVRPALSFMQRALSGVNEDGGKTGQIFAQLGLKMDELRNLPAADAMQRIGQAIQGLGSDSDKTAATMQIFGRSGAMLKSFFADPEAIETARKALGGLPAIMQQNAQLFDKISDSFGRIKAKSMGLFAGIAAGAAPALSSLAGAIDGIDLSGIGQKIGSAIGVGVELIRSGRLAEALGLAFMIGAKAGLNALANVPIALGTALIAVIGSTSFWEGISQVAIAGLMGIGAALLKMFVRPLTALQAGMDFVIDQLFAGLAKIPGAAKLLGLEDDGPGKSFEEHLKDRETSGWTMRLQGRGQEAAEIAKEMAESGMQKTKQGLGEIAGIMRSYEPVSPFGDLSAEKTKLQSLLGDVSTAANARKVAAAAPAAGGGPGGIGELEATGRKAGGKNETASDNLARIGIFVGGGGGLDYARRTASFTERIARGIDKLVSRSASTSATTSAAMVWG